MTNMGLSRRTHIKAVGFISHQVKGHTAQGRPVWMTALAIGDVSANELEGKTIHQLGPFHK